jgi:hypothetical protein
MILLRTGAESLPISEPAWKAKPSWYLVVTEDRRFRPPPSAMAKRAGGDVDEGRQGFEAGCHPVPRWLQVKTADRTV